MLSKEASHLGLAEKLAVLWLMKKSSITNFWAVQACIRYQLSPDEETVARIKHAAQAQLLTQQIA